MPQTSHQTNLVAQKQHLATDLCVCNNYTQSQNLNVAIDLSMLKSYVERTNQHFILKPSVHQFSSIWTPLWASTQFGCSISLSHIAILTEKNNSIAAVDSQGHEGAAALWQLALREIVLFLRSLYNFSVRLCVHPHFSALSPMSRNNGARLMSRRYKCQVEHWKSMKYQIPSSAYLMRQVWRKAKVW